MRVFSLGLALLASNTASAAFVTYDFSAPQFTLGSTTPLLNVAPNIGDPAVPTFTTSFTASPVSNGLSIDLFLPNSLMSPPILYVPTAPSEVLTITTSAPITSVTLDFATNGNTSLAFASPSGGMIQPSIVVGGTFPGGTLSFSSATPFSSFTLQTLSGTQFAIDDLVMDVQGASLVPVPPTCFLAACGLLALGLRTLRRR